MSEALTLLDRDPKQAFDLLLPLAEQGSVWSMLHLGLCYRKGLGVTADVAKAEYWYGRGYAAGSEWALLAYAYLLDLRGALELCEEVFRAGARKGWAPAMYLLADFLLKRRKGRPALSEARDLLERAAQQDYPGAQFILAQRMTQGRFGIREMRRGMALMLAYWKRVDADAGRDVAGVARTA